MTRRCSSKRLQLPLPNHYPTNDLTIFTTGKPLIFLLPLQFPLSLQTILEAGLIRLALCGLLLRM